MDDAFIMTTTFFNLLSPPFFNGQGESQLRRLASPPVQCRACGEPLIEIAFTMGFHLVCDNHRCHLFRQPQGYRHKQPQSAPAIPRTNRWRANYPEKYEAYKAQVRQNYRRLVNLGIPSNEAKGMNSNKQTRIALEGI